MHWKEFMFAVGIVLGCSGTEPESKDTAALSLVQQSIVASITYQGSDGVAMRVGPGIYYGQIATLMYGDKVKVLEQRHTDGGPTLDFWLLVESPYGKGWIAAILTNFSSLQSEVEQREKGPWIKIGSKKTYLKKRIEDNEGEPIYADDLELGKERCSLYANSVISLQAEGKSAGKHIIINTQEMIPGCEFSKGYVYKSHIEHMSWKQESPTSRKQNLGDFYAQNYSLIYSRAKQFWPNSYGCAAFASTALKMAGYNVSQVLLTNDVERQLQRMGWKRVSDMGRLMRGDVVFTDKSTSNVRGTWSHVYVFHTYTSSNQATVLDNTGRLVTRHLWGGYQSRSVVAYRAP